MTRIPGTYERRIRIWPGAIPGTHEPGFIERPIVERKDISWQPASGYEIHAFAMGECRILLGHEPAGENGELLWHLTISCPDRHPTWDEIKTARYRLLGPDLNCAMFLPPVSEYVNVAAQDHVFQVWEIA